MVKQVRPIPKKKIKINKVFKKLYTSKKRYFLITGGRGGLKTSSVHDFVARLTYEKGHGILFTRYTMSSAKKSIIPEFKITLRRLGIENQFHFTGDYVINKKTKSFILFSGIKTSSGDQTATLKSIAGITTWIIEEGEDFKDEKTFEDIQQSIRTAGIQNRIIWIQNPTTREHFIYKKFIKNTSKQVKFNGYNVTLSSHKNVEHIHTTYHMADRLDYLDKAWVMEAEEWEAKADAAEREKQGAKYEQYYYFNYIGGWLERAHGAIFKNWKEGPFNHKARKCYGLDFGYSPDPLALINLSIDMKAKTIWMQQKVYKTEIDDVPGYFDKVKISKRQLMVCDTNEPRTTKKIKKAKYNIVKAVKEQIVDDIREMKTYQFIVDPDSHDLKTELNNYEWDDQKESVPIGEFNHLLDGGRYAFRRLVGGKKKKPKNRY